MSAAGPSQGANAAPVGEANEESVGAPSMSAAGPSQGANSAPVGAATLVRVGVLQ